MPFQPPASGLSNTAEYMASGLPWVSSSAIPSGSTWEITFPNVTSHLVIHAVGGNNSSMAVGFTLSGSQGSNSFVLNAGANFDDYLDVHVRVTKVYITALTSNVVASVFAGLTTIPAKQFPILTGSSPLAFDITGSQYDRYLSYPGLG